MTDFCYRIHGIDIVCQDRLPAWQRIGSAEDAWRLVLDMGRQDLTATVPARAGGARWRWQHAGETTILEMTGTPPGSPEPMAAAVRFTVNRTHRVLTVEHTHDLPRGCIDMVARWLLPDLARDEKDLLPLHACAVLTDAGAVLLLGDSGAGKSALATALLACGATLIGDEPLCVGGDGVWPGPRILRTDPQLVQGLLNRSAPLDDAGKAVLTADNSMSEALAMGALVILAPRRQQGELIEITRLEVAGALTRLMGLRYTRPQLHTRDDLPRAARVVKQTAALQVSLRHDLAQLLPAAEALMAYVGSGNP